MLVAASRTGAASGRELLSEGVGSARCVRAFCVRDLVHIAMGCSGIVACAGHGTPGGAA